MTIPQRTTPPAEVKFSSYQKFVVLVLAFLQFTIVLDFMLLAPLGALVIPELKITTAQFGLIVSAYALSAGADRFDRKKLLLFFYCVFLVGTLLCGLASSYSLLLAARMVTGVFAGVVGSVVFAIVTDLFPMQMRGRVMGVLQTAFAASSVLGIPFGLLLSNRWSWNAPFFLTAAVGAAVGTVIWAKLRPIDEHLKHHPDRSPLHHLLHTVSNRSYVLGFLAAAGGVAAMLAGMIVVQTSAGTLLHFDILGYLLMGTTLVSLSLMYLINRRVGAPTSTPPPSAAHSQKLRRSKRTAV